ncbi:MAG: FAD-dependent oxidoreductase [Propionibacteriaceae bacterium]|jgi:prenylcysteine oxidase/farnesylcysteine lyase|nr:FAD-dependent oxidoreductase [Propionibacteriaceae bacterium]
MSFTIGVVGTGSAGTLAAWRLRALLGPEAAIDVFESEPRVGGRARHIEFAGERVELGGTLIHSDNRRLIDLAETLGVPLRPADDDSPSKELDPVEDVLAIWDGNRFRLKAPTSGLGLPLALIRRYGPFNLLKLRALAKKAKAAWNSVYALQDAGRVFETPDDLLTATGLDEFVGVSLAQSLKSHGIGPKLADEFSTAVLRNMYNQSADIVALAGLVGLAGAGLAGGHLVAVAAGNSTLLEAALEQAKVNLHVNTRVAAVEATEGQGAILTTGDGVEHHVDAVIIAAPIELSGIVLTTANGPIPVPSQPYQDVYTTVVAGTVDHSFFHLTRPPSTVLTVDEPGIGFRSLGLTAPGYSRSLGAGLWKFFSGSELSDDFLARVFSEVKATYRHLWKAYPVLTPAPELLPFRLAEGLYQVNGFESVVSTLETEATIGWSVADLVVRDLSGAAGDSGKKEP